MENSIVSINLDPLSDGIVSEINNVVCTSGRFVIVGTDSRYKLITEKEFYDYIEKLGKNNHQMMIGDYLIILDNSKLIHTADSDFFVGSFLLAKPSSKGGVFDKLDDYEIPEIIDDIDGYFTEIFINGQRIDALEVE
ncbi:hypothetical protein PM027_09640 [[Clostridium] symbiosum]|jgi:hypothetical protein|uniref:hypothetical protein n=1 Tax=Clostridium symbiosum TaxID=1512 RepID=UPI001897F546|nr:hypothetical protein [[Clostridium] symbiosum]MBO1699752.1 hypothetical protein [[Clostridium] symbiosum]MDB1975901.1 hypothetical protein [[Clostridium] symbiosum]MDB2018317.1 hypothetical protein [[Clostridium] symbiosum]BDF25362.1 hypothetical protein CE91St65_32420 [[Clostridium] symbiosum]BDF30267.1 hypothetical protein CE91St66_32440 [[Clostridium] symbiosum]